jgi:hypothetical protein
LTDIILSVNYTLLTSSPCNFREEIQVGGIDIRGSAPPKKYAVDVRVRDEHSLMKACLNSLNGIDIMYTVEISPSLTKNSVFVLPIEPLEDLPIGNYNYHSVL